MSWTPEVTVQRELHAGELIRWIGMPSMQAALKKQLISFAFGGFFAYMPGRTLIENFQKYFFEKDTTISIATLLGQSLFVAVGCGIIGAGILSVLATRRTAYAVTDRRLLIIKDFIKRNVMVVLPNEINAVEREEGADGRGSITFRRDTYYDGDGKGTTTISFDGVSNVKRAALEIENLKSHRVSA